MNNQESIGDYFTRIQVLVNSMKGCGEKFSDQQTAEKVLRILTPRFDHIVVAVEESKDIEKMKVEKLQNPLEGHEQTSWEKWWESSWSSFASTRLLKKFDGGGIKTKKGKWKNKLEDSSASPSKVSNKNSSDDSHKKNGKIEEGRENLIKRLRNAMLVKNGVTLQMSDWVLQQ